MENFDITFPLTDEQIKSLPTTPLELVPAPGEGKQIVVIEKDNIVGFIIIES